MRGDGRVYPRGGRWWISYYVRGVNYRRPGGATEEAARKALRAKLKEIAAGRHVAPQEERLTVSDLLAGLERHLLTNGAKSMVSFRAHAKAVREALGHRRAVDFTTEDVERFKAEKLAAKKAPATVNRYVETARSAFRLAHKQERISRLPYFPLLRLNNVRRGFFERDEFEAVAIRLPDPVCDVARFGYLTGWRKGEIVSMTWDQVDFKSGEVRLYDSKNGEGRVLELEGELRKLLDRRLALRPFKGLSGTELSRFVFHEQGHTVRDFRKSWAAACKAAKVPGRLFHDLRRSAVRDMVRAGVSRSVAKAISGHKTDAIFERYDITSGDDRREALRRTQAHRDSMAKTPEVAEIPREKGQNRDSLSAVGSGSGQGLGVSH